MSRTSPFLEASPSLYTEIDTFEEARALGGPGATWIETARAELGQWVRGILEARLAGKEDPSVRSDLGAASTVYDGLSGETPGGNWKVHHFSDDRWRTMTRRFRNGELRRVGFSIYALDESAFPGRPGMMTAEIELRALEWPDLPNAVHISARLDEADDRLDELQERLVRVMKLAAVSCKASYAHITFDRTMFAYEDAVGRSFVEGTRECQEWVRGYYWGNFLAQNHIERLGGSERVRNEAPCYLVDDLSEGRGDLVYLQLTPSVLSFTDDQLRELRSFLEPILPKGPKQSYFGPRIRVVEPTQSP